MDTGTINKGKKDEIIKTFFIENQYVKKVFKKRDGNSMPRGICMQVITMIFYGN
jgi:hypothetical protein